MQFINCFMFCSDEEIDINIPEDSDEMTRILTIFKHNVENKTLPTMKTVEKLKQYDTMLKQMDNNVILGWLKSHLGYTAHLFHFLVMVLYISIENNTRHHIFSYF